MTYFRHRGRSPTAPRSTDPRFCAAIVKHKEINAGDISFVAKRGAVTLDGTAVDASLIDKVE
ncbi:BON domain-containing protein [Burkholderia cepacia]|uniref:BON domain-containing protein n=1 Tax=Burkholderia cepacia TaxID=292 RepID=UPI000A72D672|nr:BON domain-containing protein [Burkholderia cepacia]